MVPLPPLRDGARALPISSFRQSMPSFDTRCPGLHLQPGASVVLGCVGELPGSRCTDFNPRARVRRDELFADLGITNAQIYGCQLLDFNPRAPCGARHHPHNYTASCQEFQSTRPVWGATAMMSNDVIVREEFQSTRPVWGATSRNRSTGSRPRNFNPRAPCGARRQI